MGGGGGGGKWRVPQQRFPRLRPTREKAEKRRKGVDFLPSQACVEKERVAHLENNDHRTPGDPQVKERRIPGSLFWQTGKGGCLDFVQEMAKTGGEKKGCGPVVFGPKRRGKVCFFGPLGGGKIFPSRERKERGGKVPGFFFVDQ